MNWDDSFLRMSFRVLHSMKCYPPEDYLGLAYECFAEQMDAYNPELCDNPVVYFGHRLRSHIQNWRRYDQLVHVPVKKRSMCSVEYSHLDQPVGDNGSTLADILEDPKGGLVEAPELTVEDIIDMVDEADRQLFIRYHIDEIDLTTLGDEIGVTRQAIHHKLNKIRADLRRKIIKSGKLE